jgi:hypothetical protein
MSDAYAAERMADYNPDKASVSSTVKAGPSKKASRPRT